MKTLRIIMGSVLLALGVAALLFCLWDAVSMFLYYGDLSFVSRQGFGLLLYVFLSVFLGIVPGIGLLRRKKWARESALLSYGLMATAAAYYNFVYYVISGFSFRYFALDFFEVEYVMPLILLVIPVCFAVILSRNKDIVDD